MLNFLLGLPGLIGQIIPGLFTWLNKKQDVALAENGNARDATAAIVQSEAVHYTAVKEVTTVMMSHPVYWIAWGVGVLPVLIYHACIFFVSTFPSIGWTIKKVPVEELEYARLVVGAVFTLTGTSTVVAGLASAWTKRV